MNNYQKLQVGLSVAAIICLVVGWIDVLPQDISVFLFQRLFYVLVGVSFIFQAKGFGSKVISYITYLAAFLCLVGAFLPLVSALSAMKKVGLFAGVIISMFNKTSVSRN